MMGLTGVDGETRVRRGRWSKDCGRDRGVGLRVEENCEEEVAEDGAEEREAGEEEGEREP